MKRSAAWRWAVLAVFVAFPASAIVLDGQLDPEYGPPASLQTTQTSRGDTIDAPVPVSNARVQYR